MPVTEPDTHIEPATEFKVGDTVDLRAPFGRTMFGVRDAIRCVVEPTCSDMLCVRVADERFPDHYGEDIITDKQNFQLVRRAGDFRVGDRVRYIVNGGGHIAPPVGTIGVVRAINPLPRPRFLTVQWPVGTTLHPGTWSVAASDLELVSEASCVTMQSGIKENRTIKVGSVVEFTDERAHRVYPNFFPSAGTQGIVQQLMDECGVMVGWQGVNYDAAPSIVRLNQIKVVPDDTTFF